MVTGVVPITTSPMLKLEWKKILKGNEQSCINVYFLYLLLMVPLWVVNAIEVTPLPSNGALMGSNGLLACLDNRLECLLVLNDPVSPSGVIDPFTRQCTFVIVASSKMSVCSSILSVAPQLLWLLRHITTIIEYERFS